MLEKRLRAFGRTSLCTADLEHSRSGQCYAAPELFRCVSVVFAQCLEVAPLAGLSHFALMSFKQDKELFYVLLF